LRFLSDEPLLLGLPLALHKVLTVASLEILKSPLLGFHDLALLLNPGSAGLESAYGGFEFGVIQWASNRRRRLAFTGLQAVCLDAISAGQ